jgi:hypothetical protein
MFKWMLRALIAGFTCGLVIGAVIVVRNLIVSSELFSVHTVEVRGNIRSDSEKLSIVYKPLIGRNIFQDINPEMLRTDDPWVMKLEIKRIIPDKLVVVVDEDFELFTYRYGSKCISATKLGNKIPVKCENVRIVALQDLFDSEIKHFSDIYANSELLQRCFITLKNGYFIAQTSEERILAAYIPKVFEENLKNYLKIKSRYRFVEMVDLSVQDKIFVRGI